MIRLSAEFLTSRHCDVRSVISYNFIFHETTGDRLFCRTSQVSDHTFVSFFLLLLTLLSCFHVLPATCFTLSQPSLVSARINTVNVCMAADLHDNNKLTLNHIYGKSKLTIYIITILLIYIYNCFYWVFC